MPLSACVSRRLSRVPPCSIHVHIRISATLLTLPAVQLLQGKNFAMHSRHWRQLSHSARLSATPRYWICARDSSSTFTKLRLRCMRVAPLALSDCFPLPAFSFLPLVFHLAISRYPPFPPHSPLFVGVLCESALFTVIFATRQFVHI